MLHVGVQLIDEVWTNTKSNGRRQGGLVAGVAQLQWPRFGTKTSSDVATKQPPSSFHLAWRV